MTFCVENEIEADFPFDMEAVAEQVIRKVLEAEKCPYEVEVNLLITDAEGKAIRTYNPECTREIDRETDVLSFPGVDYESPSDFSLVQEDEACI